MARIVNNRICYDNHNIVVEARLYRDQPDIVFDIQEALTPEGDAKLHRAQLDSFPNVGTYCEVERPTMRITPDPIAPTSHMVAVVTLFNGNYHKELCTARCARSESFYPLYGAMSQKGIDVGRKARREAETEYFKLYDAIVAATNQPKE